MLRLRWWQWLVLLLLLVAGTSWLISSRASQPSSSPSSASLLRLEFRAPGALIKIKTTPTTQQALALILTEIGYGQSWHYFFLPHELHPQSLEPHSLVLEFLPIEQYSPQLHPFVVERVVDSQGKLLSGTGCQYHPDSNQLHCLLFSSYDFASAPDQLAPTEFVTFSVVHTLLLLSDQLDDVRAQELGFTKLYQRLQQALDAKQLQLVALDQTEAKRFPLSAVAALFHQFKIESVQAHVCSGILECQLVQKVCKCPGSTTVCQHPITDRCDDNGVITRCADYCDFYCNGPWKKMGPFYCEAQEVYSGNNWCTDPYDGLCSERWSGDTAGTYCATRGDCWPVRDPISTPPPNSTPSPTPPNYTPPPEPTSPPTHSGCGCCDSDDWSPDDGCYERNGRQGLQCCCGTGSCYRSPDGACLDNPTFCPRNQEVYWINPVAGYVFDQEGEPVPGVEVEVTAFTLTTRV